MAESLPISSQRHGVSCALIPRRLVGPRPPLFQEFPAPFVPQLCEHPYPLLFLLSNLSGLGLLLQELVRRLLQKIRARRQVVNTPPEVSDQVLPEIRGPDALHGGIRLERAVVDLQLVGDRAR